MLDELEDIQKGVGWKRIYHCLWVIATVRYVTQQQLTDHFPEANWVKMVATKPKLGKLVNRGFLEQSPDGVISATRKAVRLLKDYSDKNYEIIKLPKGIGQRDSLYNTDVLLQIIQLPDFYALLYPVFRESPRDDQPFLIPDGAVIFKKDNMAKLVFLEIERPKPDWQNYLEEKRWKYNLIAGRMGTWSEWWKEQSKKMGLRQCENGEFGFLIWCIGEIKQDDWQGWEFKERVLHALDEKNLFQTTTCS